MLKQTIKEVATPLAHIVSLSLYHGIFPNDMKLVKIVPILKNGNTKLFNNYRLISILPAFSKILEKKYVADYYILETKNILYKHQYGFRKKHNTIHPIIHLLKCIANANDKAWKHRTLAVFLDLSKAFDTISHNILLKNYNSMVLEAYVIIGSLVIFLTENNIPKSMNTDPHLKKSHVVFHKVRFSVQLYS